MPTHPRKRGAKTRWRDYLEGKYQITDREYRDKMHCEIRKRAVQMMKDLLLICQKMPRKDRIRMFHEPIRHDEKGRQLPLKIGRPLWKELTNNLCIFPPESEHFEEMQKFTGYLMRYDVPFDIVRLVDDEEYREQKRVQLYTKSKIEFKWSEE